MTEIIDLSNPDVLRVLATQDDSSTTESPTSFLSEFSEENGDSDIEMDEEEFVAVWRRNIPPNVRQPLDIEELDNNIDGNNGEGWREGTVIPDNLPFVSRNGLLVDVGGDTPLDYFSLMVNDGMITNLVEETDRYAEQTLSGKTLSPRSRFNQWVEATVGEMRAFLGLIVAM
ncbi:Zinc finger mym-type protein 2 isoform x1 [Plakobranchus ocellatus]|uniref:Zinc finger mym-type protein 2 isoform x1 n=1 Tax=Plakobranchus ocellatus TaxID=259542 RepID=A0AAV4BPM2_9GAST|nr:Zinc finger mym-type protein 2 isoform x1 [Plakobranchus ocellatus]